MSAIRARARLHRPRPHRQVRGLLSRPRRRAAGQGRLGRATLGVPDSAGVPAAVAAATTTLPYNDAAALERCFAEAATRDRRRHRRAGGRQHGLRAARAGLPRGAARALHAPRRAADLRRGDDRLPRRARRRAGALRRRARPHHARQDRRRRHARRRLRRAARHHGAARAARPRLPGRHAVRQSRRDGRGARDARGRLAARVLRRASRRRRTASSTGSRARRARPGSRSRPTASAACSASSSRRTAR